MLSVQHDSRGDGGSIAVESDRTTRVERVEFPALLRNDGSGAVTLLSMTIEGTTLKDTFDEQVVVSGGRQPLSFTRVVDCSRPEPLSSKPQLRVRVLGAADVRTVTLPLPEAVVTMYREAHACSSTRAADRAAEEAAAREAADEADR